MVISALIWVISIVTLLITLDPDLSLEPQPAGSSDQKPRDALGGLGERGRGP